jgi:uncharacterized protein (DUF2384 family)
MGRRNGVALTMLPRQILEEWLQLGLSREDLASALGVDARTLERWRADSAFPQHEARTNLGLLEALHQHLMDTFETPEAAKSWLSADSRYLGGLSPADVVRARRLDRVEAALTALDSGVFV